MRIKGKKLKVVILQSKDHICSRCGLVPEWNGEPLILQVDHIDGNSHNNAVENLRLLCPNCHSQTPTWCNKNRSNKPKITEDIADKIKKDLDILTCVQIAQKYKVSCTAVMNFLRKNKIKKSVVNTYHKKVNKPVIKEELEYFIANTSIMQVSRYYGISDNAIRKWCKKFNIDTVSGWSMNNLGIKGPSVESLLENRDS
jgi:hypothetical protein